jgi:hypothetical protein
MISYKRTELNPAESDKNSVKDRKLMIVFY